MDPCFFVTPAGDVLIRSRGAGSGGEEGNVGGEGGAHFLERREVSAAEV